MDELTQIAPVAHSSLVMFLTESIMSIKSPMIGRLLMRIPTSPDGILVEISERMFWSKIPNGESRPSQYRIYQSRRLLGITS